MACVVCSVMAVSMVWAERVSEADAALVADHFMNVTSSSAHGQKAPAKRMVLKKAAVVEENQFYIYENADGEGWVMVAANDVVRPILAYSETGHFRTDNMPRNVKGWLQSYNKQIKHVEQNYPVASKEIQQEWKRLRSGSRQAKASVVISPLIKTGWDQDAPYWNLCPQKGSNYCYTGCVATAMAQVMNYWQWPKQGTGSHSVQYNGKTYSADFANTTYDWSNMKDSYSGSSTSAQKTAVATLMLHCGIAVDMQYGTSSEGGSAAYTIDYNGYFSGQGKMCAETALKQFFGYNSSTVKGYYRDGDSGTGMKSWTKAQWIAMLKEELDAERPIMYAGCGYETPGDEESVYGHSFVCDGYDSSNYFHFNWGWGNWCDGYYDVDALNTNDPGSGGGNGEYNYYQDVIVGIQPPVVGHSVKTNGTGCTISCNNYANNDEAFTATITPTDATYDFTSISVKLGSTTLTKTTHYTLSSDNKTLNIKASAITGDASNDLTITAVWTKNRYKYELLGENCDPEMDEGMLAKNAALNLTILPASGYTLADASCWDVEMGGATLTYGTGFTYNASNGAFAITEVTGDVAIVAYGGNAITWSANGSVFASTVALSNMIQLPTSEPEVECNGKVFVGWCADANYESESTAPTFVKNGDAVSEAKTFYAVFATPGTGGTSSIEKATSIAVGDEVILVCESKTMELSSFTTSGTIYGVGSSYSGTPSGDYSFTVVAGSETNSYAFVRDGKYWNWTSGNSLSTATTLSANTSWAVSFSGGNANITNKSDADRKIQWNAGSPRFACYTSGQTAVQLYKKVGGGAYTDYTTTCSTPCEGELTGITLNTDNVKKVFTEGEAFTYEGLVVTANYDGCESKTVTPTSVSTPDMNQIGAQDVTVTYEDKSATYQITVNALPTYAIRFFDNTTLLSSQNVKQGQAATPPTSDPTACEEYTFVGWYTTTLAEDNTVAPSYVTNFTATKDQDYYAVFSKTEEGEGGSSETVEDQLTRATTGVSGTNYDSWSGKTANSDAFYAGNSAGGNDAIQLRSNNNNSGIVTTTSGGTIKKVVVTWNSNTTSGRTLNIYGKNTAYSAASDLYGSNAGTSLGSIVYGTSTELTISGDYTYIGVRSASGALYMDAITFTWEVGSGASSTTYYTTAPTCGEIPTYTIRFFNNGVQEGEEQIIEKGGTPEIPEDPDKLCVYYTFIGWTTSALTTETETKPTLVTDFTVTKDQDYYAVFRHIKTGELSNDYSKITTLDELTTGNYVVAGNGTKAMKNSVYSSYYLGTVSVSPSSDIISDPVETIIWNITRDNNSISFFNAAVNQYACLYQTGTYHNLKMQDAANWFTPSVSDGSWTFESDDCAGWYLVYFIYGSNTHEFAAKESTTTSIYLYKQQNGSNTSYVTTVDCGALTDIEKTSVEPAAVKALMNGQIVIIRGEAVYSITGVRIK